eukprot:2973939-Amphidinium_carterae.1
MKSSCGFTTPGPNRGHAFKAMRSCTESMKQTEIVILSARGGVVIPTYDARSVSTRGRTTSEATIGAARHRARSQVQENPNR